MKTNLLNIKPLAGRLLISGPFLQDFYFHKAVVLLGEHSDDGSFGVIINKPVEVKLSEISAEFGDFDARVYLGGPVKTDSIFFIHSRPDLLGVEVKIIDGLYWGGDLETLKTLITERRIQPEDVRFYIGYSGWSPNQLDRELEEKSWAVSMTDLDQVIHTKPEEMWSDSLRKLGSEYAFWASYPAHPILN